MMTEAALNVAREPYMEIVAQNPGASTHEVALRMGVDDSTAAYHLRRLERAGHVVVERGGRQLAYFLAGSVTQRERLLGRVSRTGRAVYAVLRDAEMPMSAAEVAGRLGVNVGAVRYAMEQVVLLGLARKTELGRCEVVL